MDKRAKLRVLGFTEEEIVNLLGESTQHDAAPESGDPPGMVESVDTGKSTGELADTEQQQLGPQMVVPQQAGGCEFAHLHVHTEYSVLDGMIRIPDLIRRAVAWKMPALAITDHGNLSGAIQFYQTAKSAEIKPIIGCEVYYVPDMNVKDSRDMWHLVLLAKDAGGYENLMKITSAGYLRGLYYDKPRVDLDLISQHSDGLIAMTACIQGYVPAMILDGNVDEAKAELGRLRDIFADDLYVEIMNHDLPKQKVLNPDLIRLADGMEIPIVATNDCHYMDSDDYTAHDVLLCIQTGKKLTDEDRLRFNSNQFWFKTQDEMAALFGEGYLRRTIEVAEKCNLELDLTASHMPQFTTPDGSTAEEYLWRRIEEGIIERYGGEFDEARQERLDRELGVIERTGFCGYFLIIDDLMGYAREQGIRVGPGRGSAVASPVCYVLGITDVDPLEHNLLFERFLTEDRISPPDIDLDFDSSRRDEITDYLRGKYGHTAQILTFNRLLPRSLIRDVGRVLGVNQADVNSAAQKIPNHTEKTLAELREEIPELAQIDPRVTDTGTRLHGLIRHCGQHPGGIVISDKPLTDTIPLCVSKGVQLTQVDKDSLETCGMLKLDILGNDSLAVSDMTTELIRERHHTEISDMPMDDQATFDLLCRGDVNGIFQLGARCGRELTIRMQPRKFEDIVHILALGRPGVLDAGLDDIYFENRSAENVGYLHDSLKPILGDTYGAILYQGQIMQIAATVAGFSWSDADRLRKAIGKKDNALMTSMESRFVDGCVEGDIPREIAETLWEQIKFFGGYGFNKAHAVGYATLTYQTSYLKANYLLEYLTSLLSVKGGDEDERRLYIADARRRGIQILSPDVNISTDVYRILDDAIMLPLTAVSGLADRGYAAIIEARASGNFESYDDFCERVARRAVNIRVRENLAKAGAFDSLHSREELLGELLADENVNTLALEREALGIYISRHPLDSFPYDDGTLRIGAIAEVPIGSEFRTVGIVSKVKNYTDKNDSSMAFVTLEDATDRLEVTIFASVYDGDLEDGVLIRLHGRLDQHEPLKAIALDYESVSQEAALAAETT